MLTRNWESISQVLAPVVSPIDLLLTLFFTAKSYYIKVVLKGYEFKSKTNKIESNLQLNVNFI